MRRILLVRHGQSQGNVDDTKYNTVGDPQIELTDEGWQQAYDAGKFLRWYYRNNPPDTDKDPAIWSSTFIRARQTTKAVLNGLQWEGRRVREDMRLVEQSYGAAFLASESEHVRKDMDVSSGVYQKNSFLTPLPHGESLMNQFMRVDGFIETLRRAEKNRDESDILIISHGATMKNFLMRWFHIPDYQWKELETPHNCDVIALEQQPGSLRLQARKIYEGEHRHIARKPILDNLRPVPVPGPRIQLK